MKVLVINCGSSSLKYQLLDMTYKSVLAQGLVERIGISGSQLTHRQGDLEKVVLRKLSNHEEAISLVLECLTDSEYGVVGNLQEISAVGKGVIHGGEKYNSSDRIEDAVIQTINKYIELAPLHTPKNIAGIKICKKFMSRVPQAVFDTAFHQTMLPKVHGALHKRRQAAEMLGSWVLLRWRVY